MSEKQPRKDWRKKRHSALISQVKPKKWPWPGDTKLGQVQRIAQAYRAVAERVAPDECAAQDQHWHQYGHHWVAPTVAVQPAADEYLAPADAAHYVSQWYPCDVRLIYKWVQREHIEGQLDGNGNLFVRWGSILEWDQKQHRARAQHTRGV